MTYFSQASLLFPLVFGFVNYNKLNKPFKRLVWFFLFSAFVETGSNFWVQIFGNNMLLLHIFTIAEFSMFIYIFVNYLSINRKWFYLIISSFIAIVLIDAFLVNTLYKFNSLARTIESTILIIASLYFYYSNIKSNFIVSIYKQPMYWFSSAVIIYFSINFFMFMMMSLFQDSYPSIGAIAIKVHSYVNILSNILFAVSFVSFKWKN